MFIKWVKPNLNSWILSTEQSGGGGILQDCKGNIVLAFSCYFVHLTSVQV